MPRRRLVDRTKIFTIVAGAKAPRRKLDGDGPQRPRVNQKQRQTFSHWRLIPHRENDG